MKMARITVEDSLKNCTDIYSLIRLAAKRAHQLQHGATPKITVLKDKKGRPDFPTVIALREIAAGFTNFDNEIIPQKNIWGDEVVEQWPTPKKPEAIVAKTGNAIVTTDTKKED